MDLGRLALSRALQDKTLSAFIDRGVRPEMMPDPESAAVFKWVSDFHKDHASVPSPQTVEAQFPNYRLSYAAEPASFYVQRIVTQYARAEAIDTVLAIAKKLTDDNVFQQLDGLKSTASKLTLLNHTRTERTIDANTAERWQRFLDRKTGVGLTGIATPWPSLDDLTQGWNEEDYVVIVARPKVGKTWFMLRLAYQAWREGKVVLFVNRELPDKLMERRWDALHAKLPYERFRQGLLTTAEEARYKAALDELTKPNPYGKWIWVHGAMTVSAVHAKIEEHNPDIVFVDGAYLLIDEDGGRAWWEQNKNISRALKRTPQKYKVPLIATTQLARSGDTKKNKNTELTLSDVGGSDAYAQDADLLLGLSQSDDQRAQNQLEIIPLAVREAPPDNLLVEWNFESMESNDLGKKNKGVTVSTEGLKFASEKAGESLDYED